MLRTSMGLKTVQDPDALRRELDLLCGAGFDTADLDFSMPGQLELLHDPACEARLLKAADILNEYRFPIYMAHAPYHPHVFNDPEKEALLNEEIRLSIPAAAIVHAENLVAHPYEGLTLDDPLCQDWDATMRKNVEMYTELVEKGKKLGVHICTENLFAMDGWHTRCYPCFSSYSRNLNRVMDAVPGLHVCLDFGHAILSKQDPAQLARDFGPRLSALHLHNNNRVTDLHLAPLQNTAAPWEEFCAALAEICYTGSVNMEVGGFAANTPAELRPAAYAYLHASCAWLAERADGRK